MNFFGDKLRHYSAGHILDFGTGSGGSARVIMDAVKEYKSVTGLDTVEPDYAIEPDLLKDPAFTYVQHSELPLPFENESFDTVYSCYVLHHLPREIVLKMLQELNRVLKPGGCFLLAEGFRNHQSDAGKTEVYMHLLHGALDRANGRHHYPPFRREELTEYIEQLGFRESDVFDVTYEQDNFKDAEQLDSIAKNIDEKIEKQKHLSGYHKYYRYGELLKKRLRRTGFRGSTALAAICWKK
jgi:ubiquinone/menaquinone biosynthesis C-methylase UbiE